MFISLDWISDFVDLSSFSPSVIADRLTMSTAEVEGVETLHRHVAGVLVGEIVSAEKLSSPTGKSWTLCEVQCGDRRYTTVCGGSNVRVGLKAPFAPAGVVLGDKKIERAELAGHVSEGILCSAAELGMSSWHEMVFECPASIASGTPFAELVPETDTLIEIDNKSLTHRPDLWGHYGIARELAAIFHRPLAPLARHDITSYDALPPVNIEIADEHCPCYSAMILRVTPGTNGLPSPVKMQRRLHALGQRTYNLLVDVTNYVSLELGQPTHAFDADLVSAIRVAPMKKAGKFRTLDGVDRAMLPEDMMICDGTKPIAIAGIMGGLETEVTDKTSRIVLESANFKSARIRKTAGRLDLRTDASQRYEKSQPPFNVRTGTERILHLMAESGIPLHVESRFSIAGHLADEVREIILPPGRLNALAGIDFPQQTILDILHSIEFEAEFRPDGSLRVGVPPFRSAKDISIPEDIVEEVMRLYGFDNIPPVLPRLPLAPLFVDEYIRMEHKARRLLASGYGFLEVHNYNWMNDLWLARLGFEPGETLVLRNPAAAPESRLRTTLLPNLFTLVGKNRTWRDQFRVFEVGHVYFPIGGSENMTPCQDSAAKCREARRLAGLSFAPSDTSLDEHYRGIKAALEDLGRVFAQNEHSLSFVVTTEQVSPWEKPGCSVQIVQDGRTIGSLGYLDKQLMNVVSPEGGQVVWFELDLDLFLGTLYPTVHFTEPPKFPGSWQDFSLLWPLADGYEKLVASLDQFTHSLLLRREFVTLYSGKGLEKGMGSYSFRFEIGAADHTLSGDEIEAFHKEFLQFLASKKITIR